ncbi:MULTISPECIES: arsenite methyltransferase [Clostridium]|uniref:arsenite methyltransferase n=1 Tax=Clostridium TaxID=1485 RepID=UPI0009BE070E|nr:MULTISPECIES: arsenite methyltransferase [Clostridium]PJI10479.1 arsenite S-adenosylmethyltransferase [Clostridium sp. CT7]
MKGDIKKEVKEYYGKIASKAIKQSSSNCECTRSCCSSVTNNSNVYTKDFIDGLPDEAVNTSLGCANPVALANPQKGETILDLGSGGGIDVFISSKYVGDTGKVYGLDMTDEMLELANNNKEKMEVKNVEFIKGYIENIPLKDEIVDVITSNCVINLCESKKKALSEAYRVLKKGGRLAIADIVSLKDIPEDIKKSVEMWVGCIAGALSIREYKEILESVGFTEVEIIPVNIYTKETMKDIAEKKNLSELYNSIDTEVIDAAFAGAHVKAYK